MATKNEIPPALEARVAELEARLKKMQTTSVAVAIVAALLGGGGVAGAMQAMFDAPIKAAEKQSKETENKMKLVELRFKDLEERSKELKIYQGHYSDTIDSIKRQLTALDPTNDTGEKERLRKLLISQEEEYRKWVQNQSVAMHRLTDSGQGVLPSWLGDYEAKRVFGKSRYG